MLIVRRGICDVRTFIKVIQKSVLNEEQKIFKSLPSRGCRIVENAFGVLSPGFSVFQGKIFLYPARKARKIILACCSLHNYLMRKKSGIYIPRGLAHVKNVEKDEITAGDWRASWQLMTVQSVRVDIHLNFLKTQRTSIANILTTKEKLLVMIYSVKLCNFTKQKWSTGLQ